MQSLPHYSDMLPVCDAGQRFAVENSQQPQPAGVKDLWLIGN